MSLPRSARGGVANMLQHVATRLFAPATFFGAASHHFVLGMLLARFAASGASLSARFTNRVGERSAARDDGRGGGAVRGAVLAGVERVEVLLVPLGNHVGAVRCASVAHSLTVVAGLGARVIRGIVCLCSRNRLTSTFAITGLSRGRRDQRHRDETAEQGHRKSHLPLHRCGIWATRLRGAKDIPATTASGPMDLGRMRFPKKPLDPVVRSRP